MPFTRPGIIRDVLREERGFEGILVTDWNNVGDLETGQKICEDYAQAATLAVRCGNDMMMATPEFFQGALDERKLSTIAVIGPNTDDPLAQLGDWSLGSEQTRVGETHPRDSVVTVLDGIKKRFDGQLLYSSGCDIEKGPEETKEEIEEAVRTAERADAVVLVLGDRLHLTGETKSTATLELQGGQIELAAAVVEPGDFELLVGPSSRKRDLHTAGFYVS
jgi:hypothetical protein